MKRQPNNWEKIFANHTSDKGLISKIYEQLMRLNDKKTNKSIKKWANDLNKHFWYTDGQQTHEKMFKIINYQGNANQNYNEMSPHTCQNGYNLQDKK